MITRNLGHHFSSRNLQACTNLKKNNAYQTRLSLKKTSQCAIIKLTNLDDLIKLNVENLVELGFAHTVPRNRENKISTLTIIIMGKDDIKIRVYLKMMI
ncbi:hypothetical protein Hanom_Chr14g01262091 [Helianthus anomalus]